MSVLAAAGLGLFGGAELAVGVLFGAGVLAVVERGAKLEGGSIAARARSVVETVREKLEREGDVDHPEPAGR